MVFVQGGAGDGVEGDQQGEGEGAGVDDVPD